MLEENNGQAIDLGLQPRTILIVEKDTVFYTLVDHDIPRKHDVVLITGKGYPDVLTRKLVVRLAKL